MKDPWISTIISRFCHPELNQEMIMRWGRPGGADDTPTSFVSAPVSRNSIGDSDAPDDLQSINRPVRMPGNHGAASSSAPSPVLMSDSPANVQVPVAGHRNVIARPFSRDVDPGNCPTHGSWEPRRVVPPTKEAPHPPSLHVAEAQLDSVFRLLEECFEWISTHDNARSLFRQEGYVFCALCRKGICFTWKPNSLKSLARNLATSIRNVGHVHVNTELYVTSHYVNSHFLTAATVRFSNRPLD